MNKEEVISVVIPYCNRINILKKILPSYLSQKNLKEIIIVDDYSSDNIESYIKSLPKKHKKIKYIKNSERKGTCETKNIGIREAKGDYIFIGEDDIELPGNGYLSVLLDHLKKTKADIICSRRIWMRINETKEDSLLRVNKIKYSPVDYKLILTNCEVNSNDDQEVFLLDACMLIKKEVTKHVLFDTNLFKDYVAWRNETDFQISAAEKGFKLVFCPHIWSYHSPKPKSEIFDIVRLLRYDYFVILNNYKFSKKHEFFLKNTLNIKNITWYTITFSFDRIKRRYLLPLFRKIKDYTKN